MYRVGCSGWSYKHWKDPFYPHGLPQSRWFDHYAPVFDTVEINNSFYRTPTDAMFHAWKDRAPDGFIYAVKVNRSITQFYKLGETSYDLFDEFARRARLLGDTLGTLLLQLPPSLRRDGERRLRVLQQRRRGRGSSRCAEDKGATPHVAPVSAQ